MSKPKILFLDIETAPLEVYAWQLGKQYVSLDQVKEDWSILSWAAKWQGDSNNKIMYEDLRGKKDTRDDKKLLKNIWKLMNEADIIVTQNGIRFDTKKLNSRFKINGLGRPSPYQQIDTLKISKKHFAFTSNKLAYLSDKLC